VYGTEAADARAFAAGIARLKQINLSATISSALIGITGMAVLGVLGGAVLYTSGRGINAGTLTVGDYVMFGALLAMLVAPISSFIVEGAPMAEALAALGRVQELLDMPAEDAAGTRTRSIGELTGDVVFDNVSFAYRADTPVLHALSLHARPDSVTALVGPSGAGKSTLIGLLAAFNVPTEGTIRVDGIDLSTVQLSSYRRQLAVVLQETFLFDGTIRDNVALSRPDAGEDAIMEACRLARVDAFALAFPDGYATVVGERGVKLSGGQRQRVSIARAILADPRILILDEATSSIDSVSEALIQEALSALMKGRTTFVIAHRLSTIRRADQTLVLDKGRIVERGTHETLLAGGALYTQLYTTQYHLDGRPPGSEHESDPLAAVATAGDGATGAGALAGLGPPYQEFYRAR
jgi:subfamily B ATP-binding cassette protein MsbA